MTLITDVPPKRGGTALGRLKPLLNRRVMLLAAATVAIGVGIASSWNWLVAIGLAPILLALLPCAAMCALGYCAMSSAKKGGAGDGRRDAAARSDLSARKGE